MARINVEDRLELDPRFRALARRLGSDDAALGMLVRFWRLAQHHWGREKELVPAELFDLGGFEPLEELRFAERRENGIYARGSEEAFKWYLLQCRKSKRATEGKRRKADERRRDSNGDNNVGRFEGNLVGTTEDTDGDNPPSPTPSLDLDHKYNPQSPLSERATRRAISDESQRAIDASLHAFLQGFDQRSAREHIGDRGFAALIARYGDWDRFCGLLANANRSKALELFLSQTQKSIRVQMQPRQANDEVETSSELQ